MWQCFLNKETPIYIYQEKNASFSNIAKILYKNTSEQKHHTYYQIHGIIADVSKNVSEMRQKNPNADRQSATQKLY